MVIVVMVVKDGTLGMVVIIVFFCFCFVLFFFVLFCFVLFC